MSRVESSRKLYTRFTQALREGAAVQKNRDPDKPPPSARRKAYLSEYRRWLRPYFPRLVVVFLLALVSAVLVLVMPLATKYIIDDVIPHPTAPPDEKLVRLAWVCLAVLVLMLAAQAIDTVRTYTMSVLNAQIVFRLRRKLFASFLRLPLTDLTDYKSGGIVSRLSQDTDKVMGMVQMALITPGVMIIRVVLTIAVLIFLSWPLAVVAAMLIPPIVLLNIAWIRKVKPIYRSIADDRSELDARVTEVFGGIRVVRSFGRERKEEHDYAVSNHAVIRKNLLAERMQLVVSTAWGLVVPATTLAIVGFGGYLVIRGHGTIGDIIAFQMYALLLLGPVSAIVQSFSATQQALAALDRVFEVLEKPLDKPDAADAITPPETIREIRIEDLGFSYRAGLTVLQDVNLTVPAGATVALVGPSGGGKTTLCDLVARFHDPTSGRILINGVDLRTLRLADYRRRLAVVQQEVFLFDGTVHENIAYGRRHASAAAVEQAARRANAHEFIARLPEGYETLIGERGVKLSGGQRQRLSIARAVLADPEILIMDEATSNLDSESEQLIQAALADLFAGRTTFIIAHRLSTIQHADMIVVLNQGRVEQVGRHAELLTVDGLYRAMVERQQRANADACAALTWQ